MSVASQPATAPGSPRPLVQTWTGVEVRALRTARRMSVRQFAAHLGVSDRIVSKWEAGGTTIRPRPVNQEALDTSLRMADPEVQARFRQAVGNSPAAVPVAAPEVPVAKPVAQPLPDPLPAPDDGHGAWCLRLPLSAERAADAIADAGAVAWALRAAGVDVAAAHIGRGGQGHRYPVRPRPIRQRPANDRPASPARGRSADAIPAALLGLVNALDAPAQVADVYRLLQGGGMGQRAIGALVGQAQSEISEVLHGRRVRDVALLARIADGIGCQRRIFGLADN